MVKITRDQVVMQGEAEYVITAVDETDSGVALKLESSSAPAMYIGVKLEDGFVTQGAAILDMVMKALGVNEIDESLIGDEVVIKYRQTLFGPQPVSIKGVEKKSGKKK